MMHKLPSWFLLLLTASLATAAEPVPEFKGGIERLDPAFDKLIAPDTKVEVLATGFNWSEGPVWHDDKIIFSDVPENTAFAWKEGDTKASVFLKPSGSLDGKGGQGSNGLATDAKGNLILCQHGERRVARLEKDGSFTTLADRFEGKRFNSPNDLVISSTGDIFFTDPPYGLGKGTAPEIDFHGAYRVTPAGKVSAVITDVKWPNGIALSPDEKTLYIAVSDPVSARIMAYDLTNDGAVKNGRVLFDAQPLKSADRKGACDGMKVDASGNIWTTGPGGVLILSKEGKHLGSILTGVPTGNCAWGGANKDTMFVTADMFLLRVKTKVKGS
jgi:gluconolactonase